MQRRKGLSQIKGENGQMQQLRGLVGTGSGSGGGSVGGENSHRSSSARARSSSQLNPAGWDLKGDGNGDGAAVTPQVRQRPGCLEVAAAVSFFVLVFIIILFHC